MIKNPHAITSIIVGNREMKVDDLDLTQVKIWTQEGDEITFSYKNKKYKVQIEAGDSSRGGHLRIKSKGAKINAKVRTMLDELIDRLGFNEIKSDLEKEILAPMPGLVLEIFIKEGDEVKEGDRLLTLEAMKMENIIKASSSGIVSTIHVEEGEKVDKNSLLVAFE